MAESQHTDELRNVSKDDEVHLYTSEGENFSATCVLEQTQYAHPDTGEIRESNIWQFDTPKGQLAACITDGMKSSPDDPDFPQHSALYSLDRDEPLGFIESIDHNL